MKIKRSEVKDFIKSVKKGKIFSVGFIKKDGTFRKIATMNGTSKGVTGKGLSFDPDKKGMTPMYDLSLARKTKDPEKCWRMVSYDKVLEIKVNNQTITIDDEDNVSIG